MTDWEEIGESDHPAQNPPPLDDEDGFVMDWYRRHCSVFSQEAGLTVAGIEKLGLDEAAREIFIAKLQRIHQTMLRLQKQEIEKKKNG